MFAATHSVAGCLALNRRRLRATVLLLFAVSAGCAGRATEPRKRVVVVPALTATAEEPLPEFVLIPGGTFMMGGGEEPTHDETVATFEIQRTDVTTAQYRKCVEAGVCSVPVGLAATEEGITDSPECLDQLRLECNYVRNDREDHPINCVTYAQGEAYCRWSGSRLPSEAEWEFAARGQEARKYPWGNEEWSPRRANLCDKTCSESFDCRFVKASRKLGDGFRTTANVGAFPHGATPLGVLDMAGNVWEWTATSVGGTATERVLRGESWAGTTWFWFRGQASAVYATPTLGFRCARDRR